MANLQFKCPQCGNEIVADDSYQGQVAECPHCGKGIVVPQVKPRQQDVGNTGLGLNSRRSVTQNQYGAIPTANKSNTIPERHAFPSSDASTAADKKSPKSKSLLRKILIILLTVIGVAVAIAAASYGGYLYFGDIPRLERGIAHYEKKAYLKAMKLLLPLAKKGNAKAQLYIGDCYAKGNGVVMDSVEAVKWYRAAADQELPEAQHRMFACYRDGVGIERNQANAAKCCRKAADAGLEEAMYDMGMLYVNGKGVEKDAKSAIRWFRRGAERGHPPALYKFGQCYKIGYGTEKNEDEASKWQYKAVDAWRKMAQDGDTSGMLRLAKLYMKGDVVELDREEAVKWYRRAAEAGDAYAQFELADCYCFGNGVEKDVEEAAKWMLKSAEQGNSSSQWVMGRFYEDGTGVEKDMAEAVKWFDRAMKKGNTAAKCSLAVCYLRGEGVQKDEDMAVKLLTEAADADNEVAKKVLSGIQGRKQALKDAFKVADEIKAVKMEINNLLAGKTHTGFGIDELRTIDPSMPVALEDVTENVVGNLSKLSIGSSDEEVGVETASLNVRLNNLRKRKVAIEKAWQKYEKKLQEQKAEEARQQELARRRACQCGGSGKIDCPQCKGARLVKKLLGDCGACDGKGKVAGQKKCDACNGTGEGARQRCARCGGRGWNGCTTCKGRGFYFQTGSLNKYPCSDCGGTKRVRCYSCSGSGYTSERPTCGKCNGSGFAGETLSRCQECMGTGKVYDHENCPTCSGSGKVVCPKCISVNVKEESQKQKTTDEEEETVGPLHPEEEWTPEERALLAQAQAIGDADEAEAARAAKGLDANTMAELRNIDQEVRSGASSKDIQQRYGPKLMRLYNKYYRPKYPLKVTEGLQEGDAPLGAQEARDRKIIEARRRRSGSGR